MNITTLNQIGDRLLRSLIEPGPGTRISLLLPVQQEPDKRSENPIRLKNLLREAEEKLARLSIRQPEISRLLSPAEQLVSGGRFQSTESPGLVIYLDQEFDQAYQLPYSPAEGVFVGSHFQIKPLIPLRIREPFYILALSQKGIRLLRGERYSVERVDLGQLPQSLDEALRWDDPERELQWHSQTGNAGDGRAAVFYGHGVGTREIHKENLLRYFQMLDKGVNKIMASEKAPLLLAGVDYLLPIYREANTYPHISEEEITGSQQHLSDSEIQVRARALMRQYFRRQRAEAVSRYERRAAEGVASTNLPAVLRAAYQGRVETLFVALDEQVWGSYDAEADRLEERGQPQPEDVDLLNLAAVYSLANGGEVFPREEFDFASGQLLAAIYRF